mmetsp:Transcript_35482/g.113365  ORF Transcript_35482/g.113365 Transcript_35482/m.113365 type:complete len:286 (+) Transcript_35482:969-1826(+)
MLLLVGAAADEGLGGVRGVDGLVVAHDDDGVGDGEVISGSADDEDRRDAVLGAEVAYAVDEGRDGFVLVGHEAPHSRVADHEVRRAGVLVEEEAGRAGLDGLGDGGGLGRRPRGVLRREVRRGRRRRRFLGGLLLLFLRRRRRRQGQGRRERADEGRDVDAVDGAAVFCSDLGEVRGCDAELPSVAGDLVVTADGQGREDRRLSVEAAAADERDAFRQSEAVDRPSSAVLQSDPQRRRLHEGVALRREGYDAGGGHGSVVVAGAARQDGAVADERDEFLFGELVS